MVNKPMRCASKVINPAAARLTEAAYEIKSADAQASAAGKNSPATTIAGAFYESNILSDPRLYVKAAESLGADAAKPAGPGTSKKELFDKMLGLFDSYDEKSSSTDSDYSENAEDVAQQQEQSDYKDHFEMSAILPANISQEERARNTLRNAPQKKPWLPTKSNLTRWSGMTNDRYKIPLFDSSRIHCPGEDLIDVFFRHRWYCGKQQPKNLNPLFQAWDAFVHNVLSVGREAWLDKLVTVRDRFEKRSFVGARFKLHRLSREAGLPCLSWGDPCPCCFKDAIHAPREAYSLDNPYWTARISYEIREGIDNLQYLYKRAKRSFVDVPCGPLGEFRNTDQRDLKRHSSVGSETFKYHASMGSLASERGSSFEPLSSYRGLKSASRGSTSHSAILSRDEKLEDKSGSTYLSDPNVERHAHNHVLRELRGDLKRERDARNDLTTMIQSFCADRSDDRAKFAIAQLESERVFKTLRNELAAARQEIAYLKDRMQDRSRKHKSLVEVLKRGGYIRPRKKPRSNSTDGGFQRKM